MNQIPTDASYQSISLFPEQSQSAWQQAQKINMPSSYQQFSSLLFCGMGGSAYAARIIKTLYQDSLSYPVDLITDYHLPAYTKPDTLVIAASYSGNTEETISCLRDAEKSGAKIVGISSGGMLQKLLQEKNLPCLAFTPEFNPSLQPRMGQGYMLFGQLGLLKALHVLNIEDHEVSQILKDLKTKQKNLLDIEAESNPLKQLGLLFQERIVNFLVAEFLAGAIHPVRNSLHESSKHFANYFVLPEANHHLMEGLQFPKDNPHNLIFALVKSPLYSETLKKRMELTRQVIEQNHLPTVDLLLTLPTKLGQVCELIQLGSLLSLSLAALHKVVPAEIPWVNYFKKNLKEE